MDYDSKDKIKKGIKDCLKNKRKAQKQLYLHFYEKMMRMCMRYTHDRDLALQIYNDGMLKVFKQLGTYDFNGSFEGWIRKIIFHTLSDHYRSGSSKIRFIALESKHDSVSEVLLHQLYYDDLVKLINPLPEATKNVFILYAIEGYKHKEIAQKLNINEGTSKWHLANARKLLKEKITNQKKMNYVG